MKSCISFRSLLPAALSLIVAAAPASAQEPLTHTVDVSGEWVFLDLSAPTIEIPVGDPATSEAWDLGILSTTIAPNGGESGPADVVVHCLCDNQSLGAEAIQALTAESELADFDSVSSSDVPDDPSAWSTGAFDANPWYRYNLGGQHFIWPTYDVYLIKRGREVYKVQFISFYGPEGEPRQLTVRYANLGS